MLLNAVRNAASLVFDCDGVLLNSNRIKTEAFREVGRRFGEEAAEALVQFHVQNGGVSRFRKFEYLISTILGKIASPAEVERLASDYGECVYRQLLVCEVTPGLFELRAATNARTWAVVSGGAQAELRSVFAERGLAQLFDGGVFGSPDNKDEILFRELGAGRLKRPGVFLGDSRYDHEAATRAGLAFVFVHQWSEFPDWQGYCAAHGIPCIERVSDLQKIFDL